MRVLLTYIGVIFLGFLSFFSSLSQNRDSLWNVWNNAAAKDSVRIDALDHLCFLLAQESNNDSVQKLANLAYAFAKQHRLEKQKVRALLRKADAYYENDDERLRAYDIYMECYRLSKKLNYDNGIGASLNNIGTIYLNWGDCSNAIHYYYEGLKVIERRHDASQRAAALSNIATVYSHIGQFDSAINIAKKALPAALKEERVYASVLKCLGKIYEEAGKNDSAVAYFNRAIFQSLKTGNFYTLRHSYFDLAIHFFDRKDPGNAKKYLEKSRVLHEQFSDSVYIGKCMALEALLNYEEGNKTSAIQLAKRALVVIAKNIDKRDQMELVQKLSEWYEEKGDYKSAYGYKMKYSQLQDSVHNSDAKNALHLEQLKYTTEKKAILAKGELDRRIALLREDTEKRDLKKTIWTIVVVTSLVLVCVFAWFRYQFYKQKAIIEIQKNKLMKQQLLTAQMNPHFIFNSLNAIQNFIYSQNSYQAGIYLKQFSELIRMMLNFSRKEVISLEEEYQFLENYLDLQQLRFNGRFKYQLSIDPNLERDLIHIPPMMAQPFIENAIEHGLANKGPSEDGLLSVTLRMENNFLLYEIEDNGIGLKEAMRIQQELGKKHHSLAIDITKERLKEMNKTIDGPLIEIKDKSQANPPSSGVYVKFTTPFLTL